MSSALAASAAVRLRLLGPRRGRGGYCGRIRSLPGLRHQSSTSLSATFNARAAAAGPSSWTDRIGLGRSSSSSDRGLFLIPQLGGGVSPREGFAALRRECAERAADLVREACADADSSPSSTGGGGGRRRIVAAVFDDLSDELCRVADMAEFLRVAHPDEDTRRAAAEACVDVSGMVEKLNTHLGETNLPCFFGGGIDSFSLSPRPVQIPEARGRRG